MAFNIGLINRILSFIELQTLAQISIDIITDTDFKKNLYANLITVYIFTLRQRDISISFLIQV